MLLPRCINQVSAARLALLAVILLQAGCGGAGPKPSPGSSGHGSGSSEHSSGSSGVELGISGDEHSP